MSRVVVAVLLGVLTGCSGAGDSDGVVASDWWVRAPIPGQQVTAGYGVLVNNSDVAVRVVRVVSACCRLVEMHRSVHSDGRVQMLPVPALGLTPGQRLEFVPGGYHLMLYEPQLDGLEELHLRFYLDDGGAFSVRAAVRATGASPASASPEPGNHRR